MEALEEHRVGITYLVDLFSQHRQVSQAVGELIKVELRVSFDSGIAEARREQLGKAGVVNRQVQHPHCSNFQ